MRISFELKQSLVAMEVPLMIPLQHLWLEYLAWEILSLNYFARRVVEAIVIFSFSLFFLPSSFLGFFFLSLLFAFIVSYFLWPTKIIICVKFSFFQREILVRFKRECDLKGVQKRMRSYFCITLILIFFAPKPKLSKEISFSLFRQI